MPFLPNLTYQYLISTIYKLENSLQTSRNPSTTTDLTASPEEDVTKIVQSLTQNIDLFTDRSSLLTLFTKVMHLENSLGDDTLKQTLHTVHQLFETKISGMATTEDLPLDRSLELTAAIEELQDIASRDPHHPLFISNIQSWFAANQASFDQETLRALPINQQLQLIALLASLKEHLPHHSHFVSRLSNQMERYFREFSTADQKSALQEINRLFTTPEHQRIALAHFINCRHISLKTAVSALSLTKEDLLSLAPYLKYVDLRYCNLLEGSNDTINFLNHCSSLTHLFISNNYITSLPALPLCTTLQCSFCLNLQRLPALPLCTTLNCENCQNLKALPALPLCTTLKFLNCKALTALPQLPLCTNLQCCDCPALRTLPQLPLCTTLACSRCHTLTALPDLPLCTFLDCSFCPALRTLPALPCCTHLHCPNCPTLTALPALPCCTTLNCEDCPSLQGLPELLQNIRLYTGNTNNRLEFTKLHVKIDELKKNPKKYLLQLGKEFLLQRRPFPNIYYYNSDGSKCEAIDAGGVRRDFISSLFERLFMGNQLSIDPGPPIYPKLDGTKETKRCYEIIGVFFTLCYPRDSFFKIGEIFDENFFALMKLLADPEIPEESLIRSILLLRIPDNSKIRDKIYALSQNPSLSLTNEEKPYATPFINIDTTASLRENLILEARQDKCLPAIQVIASAMKSHLAPPIWNEFIRESAADSQARIQGRISKDLLLRRLNWKKERNVSDASYTQTQGFLTDWIDRASHEDLKCFVKTVTGNNTLGPDLIEINICNQFESNIENRIPQARTCFFRLILPSEYPNQETFDTKLKILLEQGGQGFQMS